MRPSLTSTQDQCHTVAQHELFNTQNTRRALMLSSSRSWLSGGTALTAFMCCLLGDMGGPCARGSDVILEVKYWKLCSWRLHQVDAVHLGNVVTT